MCYRLLAVVLIVIFIIMYIKCGSESFSASPKRVFLHYVDWCPHCTRMKPVWQRIKSDMAANGISNIIFSEVDESVTPTPGINMYPTVLLVDAGGKLHKYIGGPDYNSLRTWIVAPTYWD